MPRLLTADTLHFMMDLRQARGDHLSGHGPTGNIFRPLPKTQADRQRGVNECGLR